MKDLDFESLHNLEQDFVCVESWGEFLFEDYNKYVEQIMMLSEMFNNNSPKLIEDDSNMKYYVEDDNLNKVKSVLDDNLPMLELFNKMLKECAIISKQNVALYDMVKFKETKMENLQKQFERYNKKFYKYSSSEYDD